MRSQLLTSTLWIVGSFIGHLNAQTTTTTVRPPRPSTIVPSPIVPSPSLIPSSVEPSVIPSPSVLPPSPLPPVPSSTVPSSIIITTSTMAPSSAITSSSVIPAPVDRSTTRVTSRTTSTATSTFTAAPSQGDSGSGTLGPLAISIIAVMVGAAVLASIGIYVFKRKGLIKPNQQFQARLESAKGSPVHPSPTDKYMTESNSAPHF